jgi:prepilin-type N-terminal cleavage/methylation domain-containing protein
MKPVATSTKNPGSRSGESGFTLVELLVVVLLIGLALGYGVASYSGFTEEQRLHSTVREFVGEYRRLRAYAAKERRDCFIEIDIQNGDWRTLIYPMTDEMGNYIDAENQILNRDDVEERRATMPWNSLPNGIFLKDIQAPGPSGNETFDIDYWIKFRSDGTLPPHVLHFATDNGLEMSIEIEEITGDVTVREGYVDFYAPQEDEFENLSTTTGSDDG